MSKKFKSDNYIHIQGWMITELKLSGNELLIFALIYGFSQDGESIFNGSISYLCSAINCTKPTIINTLSKLIEKGIVCKNETFKNGIKFCEYYILPGVKKLYRGSKEFLPGGGKETLPNNKDLDNKYNNKDTEFENSAPPPLQENESIPKQPKRKEKTVPDLKRKEKSLYENMVEVWLKQIHPGWTFSALHGKKIKSIGAKIKSLLEYGNKSSADSDILRVFIFICKNMPEWFKDKDLPVIDSKFNEIVESIRNKGKNIEKTKMKTL